MTEKNKNVKVAKSTFFEKLQDNYIGEINMRYNMDSFLEIEENQAVLFFEVVAGIRKEINAGTTKGRTYNDFIKAGVSTSTMSMLKASKFLSYHDKKNPVWVSWKNDFYEDRTIENLYWEWKHHLGYDLPILEIKTFDK